MDDCPVRLAAVSVKCIVRTYRHIKTGWCSTWRVAHLGMAAARNRHAANDGASNLRLCGSGSLRVMLAVRRFRAGRHQRKCKHNGRNKGYDCFHRYPPSTSASQCRQRCCLPFIRKWFAFHLGQSRSPLSVRCIMALVAKCLPSKNRSGSRPLIDESTAWRWPQSPTR